MVPLILQFAYLCTIGCCLYTSGWLLLRADHNWTTWSLAACQILVIIWCIPNLFFDVYMTLGMKYFLYGISYIGISLIGPAWLIFSFFYCGKGRKSWVRGLLFGISIFDYVMFLTNENHHLFYQRFEVAQTEYGPIFYFHMAYTYFCVLLGMAAVMREFGKKKVAAVHMALILLSAAVPLGFNLLYISRLVKTGFDLTPPAFALSSFFMLLAVFRYDFLDVNVLAFEHIFESIAEGVLVYNRRGIITYCNEAAERWLGVQTGESFQSLQKVLLLLGVQVEKEQMTGQVLSLPDGSRIQLKQYLYRDKRGRMAAGTFLLSDVGEYYELLRQGRELAVSQQRLAIEQERNRIAQEVHDTTGHTLTMIQSLIKLSRIAWESESEKPQEDTLKAYLLQAQTLAADGIRELRWSINHMRQGSAGELVTQGVCQLAGSVKELKVEVEIQGKDGPRYSHLSGIVYNCLREAITNCLKYADASRMDVIVKFTPSELCLYIFDDGKGCDDIQESNGICGMHRRVEAAGGKVRILSAEGEGFQIYVKLPVEEES